ncbi:MAG: DnaA regulatory inactivator Hda [Gammaproteobacteria bacterium]|nr:DnaA regulatory inactivator Hda [Gammaproteobacteria bacterium]
MIHHIDTQLTLDLSLNDEAKFENFFDVGSNAEVISELKGTASQVFLWGSLGSGRTHLLQSVCHEALTKNESSIYIPLLNANKFSPEILQGLENVDTICVDDIQFVQKKAAWEEALFQLYNKAKDSGSRLVISANQAPPNLELTLADLQSRLCGLPVFKLSSLDESWQMEVLKFRAKQRGIKLSVSVADYIVARSQRDMHGLICVLDAVDQISFAEKRRITIPLIKKVMHW